MEFLVHPPGCFALFIMCGDKFLYTFAYIRHTYVKVYKYLSPHFITHKKDGYNDITSP